MSTSPVPAGSAPPISKPAPPKSNTDEAVPRRGRGWQSYLTPILVVLLALAVLITSKSGLAEAVAAEVKAQAKGNAIAKQSLAAQGCIFVTATVRDAQELTNRLAPEHLTVDTANDLKWVRNAGSVFVGDHTPQSMGDYVSGPNHVLPTGRVGRVRGGLSVMDFVKVITVQEYTHQGLKQMGPHAIALAEAEGLTGHAKSVRVRMQ